MEKSSDNNAGAGGGDKPGATLTREEVMAQRAEKKKLKEARKNKSAGAAPAVEGASGEKVNTNQTAASFEVKNPTELEKSSDNNAGAGEGDTSDKPGAALTREEVMAQRAEKKKLKEARKNKSAGAAPAVEGASGEKGETPATEKIQQAGKNKKPQQQASANDPKSAKSQQQKKQNSQTGSVEASDKSSNVKVIKTSQQQQKEKSQSPKPTSMKESAFSTSSGGAQSTSSTVPPTTDNKEASATAALTAAVTVTKSETPDRSIGGNKPEFQSTIQSLFQVKKSSESAKNKKFQLHPLFHSLGVKLRHNVIRGTNLRCVALLHAIQDYVKGYKTPPNTSFKHEISKDLQHNLDALREICPFAIGMNNAVEFLNTYLYKMEQDVLDITHQKEQILEVIEQYIEEKIEKAVEAIVMYGAEKVRKGDVVMIYSITEAVLCMLEKAAEKEIFDLIVIQTPETVLDIPILLQKLSKSIKAETIKISSVSFPNAIYRIRHCTKLVIGGHGLFTTGGVMAQSGSGQLALLAATYNKPTIFLCETYKFCDRSPLDFFTLDEYMPEQAITDEGLFQPKIKYDVTPANLVTVVITDIDLLPSTSVPVVLRLQ